VGPRAGLDGCGKCRLYRDSIPDRPARSASLCRLSYPDPRLSSEPCSFQRGGDSYSDLLSLTPCIMVGEYKSSGGTYCLFSQDLSEINSDGRVLQDGNRKWGKDETIGILGFVAFVVFRLRSCGACRHIEL
jgi:hypothetical protein